ncbi:MAG: 5'-methylthioadenosine/adenosylhomocysteine nucleosidase [Elusimicrobiaceae bacterium]|jgi:adenosylhomocysteine nucleosidase|nr:5'-methylthioadenosine/adenosylhomocysteine nucleosidase [Elusimicrobiaceae bacterium]MBT3954919.1 5'-methylthioadenosine/adenosylhomocysteine nucleosidase [Elusimicrobiaceae bacterium]MBT4008569.1 5'-methylthioadenosine/adenosylhomocysteine nucleosidase [Elusimicrobiaceae bacterium]MBT4402993.1 5'-methylthioadenosine/adenosylhomocysteine nucleosidase [Elusimicrobiaceae bacterium]MBT4439735.1 5'-methylthioadenosine/adenosylhomocysteine nucleosidase [Elusimicrobiaceae bacterium]
MIAIIAANEDLKVLRQALKNEKKKTEKSFSFYSGKIGKNKVVLANCDSFGKVSSAMCATLVVKHFKPSVIINTGLAGGLDKKMQVGDAFISNQIVQHDVDITVLKFKHGELPNLPAIYKANEKYLKIAKLASKKTGTKSHVGLIASGDQFIHEKKGFNRILKIWKNAKAVDMEAGAIAQVCHVYKTPFIVVRFISDVVFKKGSHKEYETTLKTKATNYMNFIKEIINLI